MHDNHLVESMTDSDDDFCPICCGPMDDTDLSFFPCPCKFQLCLWCFNEIKEKDNRCPNCRQPYDPDLYTCRDSSVVENEEDIYSTNYRRKRRSYRGVLYKRESDHVHSPKDDAMLRLQKTRVVQRNLVYITGMVREDSTESILQSDNMFGKYGKVLKIVINKSVLVVNSTVNFYITFEKEEDALACIHAINGYRYKGKLLRASFGTTKYCNSYIHGSTCDNRDCIYLHEEAPAEYCFLRDEMNDKDDKFFQCTHPGYDSLPYSKNTIKRMEIRCGDELPERDEELYFFGIDPLWEDQFNLKRYKCSSPIKDVFFSADIPITTTQHTESRGEQVNLNDLFNSSASPSKQSFVDEQSILEQLFISSTPVITSNRKNMLPTGMRI